MESLSDFEVFFYDGAKLYFGKDLTKLIQGNGSSLTFNSPESIKDLAPHMWKYVEECRQHCNKLEQLYTTIESCGTNEMPVFPLTVGRRPECCNSSPMKLPQPVSSSTPNDGNVQTTAEVRKEQVMTSSPQHAANAGYQKGHSTVSSQNVSSHSSNTASQVTNQAMKLNKSSSSNSSTSSCSRKSGPFTVCKVFIQEIGWASQWSNGEISVQYVDGCEMSIESNPMVVGFTNIKGTKMRFTQSDQLPVLVRKKMENLPTVMERLEKAQLDKNGQ